MSKYTEAIKVLERNKPTSDVWSNRAKQEADLRCENSRLKDENSKLKSKIEENIECAADCGECKHKCRAWQNGYNQALADIRGDNNG